MNKLFITRKCNFCQFYSKIESEYSKMDYYTILNCNNKSNEKKKTFPRRKSKEKNKR